MSLPRVKAGEVSVSGDAWEHGAYGRQRASPNCSRITRRRTRGGGRRELDVSMFIAERLTGARKNDALGLEKCGSCQFRGRIGFVVPYLDG